MEGKDKGKGEGGGAVLKMGEKKKNLLHPQERGERKRENVKRRLLQHPFKAEAEDRGSQCKGFAEYYSLLGESPAP